MVGKSESTRMVEDLRKVKVLWSLRWAVPPEVEGDHLAFEREREINFWSGEGKVWE